MVTLKYNPAMECFDCYANSEYLATLTCGSKFNLYCVDEEIFVAVRIEHHNTNDYYFICEEQYVSYLCNGMKGIL